MQIFGLIVLGYWFIAFVACMVFVWKDAGKNFWDDSLVGNVILLLFIAFLLSFYVMVVGPRLLIQKLKSRRFTSVVFA